MKKMVWFGTFVAMALILAVSLVTAQSVSEVAQPDAGGWGREFTHGVLASLLYSVLGLVVLLVGFKLFDAITPFSLNKEIAEDQNVAAGVVVAGIMVALGIIVAAAIL